MANNKPKKPSVALPAGEQLTEGDWSVKALIFNKVGNDFIAQVITINDPKAIQVLESKNCANDYALARGSLEFMAVKHGVFKV